ncbi:iron complex transport system ATP-binding protein [Treponema rectale]|uniref:Iron complex transport system ATP-binding protein n=1 Tax=Treponema rectale TaxID=744512 RepID=A0A840S8E4_9SPIR|nr:ABC transporter ATP-binding protein [Treponema rectale]MBB5218899.1 iron complex transport system ATP-binding protein [Treponema rectale]
MHTLEARLLNARWKYSDKDKFVLKDINICVKSGEFICLSGPNGSGKSTLLSLLSGIIPDGLQVQNKGTVFIDGMDVYSMNRKLAAKKVVYMSQTETSLWDFTVRDVVVMGRYPYTGFSGIYSKQDFMVTDEVLEGVQLQAISGKSIFELSGGEWQKVRIARTLVQQPEFILLDEPVANLDFTYQDELLTFIKAYGKKIDAGVIVSIHDLNTAARYAEKLIFLGKENYFNFGLVEEVFDPDVLKKVYGADFAVFNHPVYKCPQICLSH